MAALAIMFAATAVLGQSWQTISQTGFPKPSYTIWTNTVYDYQNKTLLLTQDDSAAGSWIWADAMFSFNPTNGLWTQLWVSDVPNQMCPGNTVVRPNHRETYNQITYDTLRNKTYITSGSCDGGLEYDWYSFTHNGIMGSGSWFQSTTAVPNPNIRQESAMVYMPNVDRVLLYGGYKGVAGVTSAEAWEYSPANNTWTRVCSTCAPGARHAHIMVYDYASGKVVLYGGERSYNGADIAQTYLYDPTQPVASRWTAANPHPEAPASAYTCHAYDKQRNRILIYPARGHVYAYTVASNAWTDLGITGGPNPAPSPGGSVDTFCGYDYDNDWLVLFSYPGVGGGPPLTYGINFGHPPNTGGQ